MFAVAGTPHSRRKAAIVSAVVGVLFAGAGWVLGTDGGGFTAQVADAPICDPRFCGNDQEDPGEDCDDGNAVPGDGCDALCRLECTDDGDCPSGECAGGVCRSLCGNGTVDPPLCVTEGGGFDCPAPAPGEVRIVHLPGDGFSNVHASGDLNKDGRRDIVVAYFIGTDDQTSTSFTATIQAYINKGNGEFEDKRLVGTFQWNRGGGQRGLDVADVDQDGDADVLVYDGNAQGIVLLRNNNLTFTPSTVIPGRFAFYLYHGDVNGDSDPELGTSGFDLGVSGVYNSDVTKAAPGPSFSTSAKLTYMNGYDTFRFADMNGDGKADAVTVGTSATEPVVSGVLVHMGNGDGTFAPPVSMLEAGVYFSPFGMDVGDLNGDGRMDVVFAGNGGVTAILGDGQGGSLRTETVEFPFSTRFVALADPTADGKLDIVTGPGQGTEGRNLWVAAGAGNGSFSTATRLLTVNPPASGRPPFTWNYSYYYNYDLRAADYDGDGRLDLSLVHALSSDGASVIYFRSSLDGCTQLPPVVVCSQPEQCDDGAENGQPGRCTRQCTYCGNGVIDTVNNIAEQCDEGPENGKPGSGCTDRCIEVPAPRQHLACVGVGQCGLVDGEGPNDCTAANAKDVCCDPALPTCKHMKCVGVGSCAEVQGPGQSQCSLQNAQDACCDPLDEGCRTASCDPLTDVCVDVQGPGVPQCLVQPNNCPASHLVCENERCTAKPGEGTNECSSPDGCLPKCDNDASCEAGESCSCNDCKNEAKCTASHLACVGIGQCAVVKGEGPDSCLDGIADCPCSPTDPFCTHAQCVEGKCVEVPGAGMPLCTSDADCTCPASDPDCHSLCDVSDKQCVAVSAGICDPRCAEIRHLACENERCTLKPGPGKNECSLPDDCLPPCNNDKKCDAAESCSCNDCKDDAKCVPSHLACVGVGQCAVVKGEGRNDCTAATADIDCCDPADPECKHMQCTGVGACTVVQGPGHTTCSSANAATDCPCDPADPSCTTMQCDALTDTCESIQGAGAPLCGPTKPCGPTHLTCVNLACTTVVGEGTNECVPGDACDIDLCPNGTVDPGEACDDGNGVDGDACTNDCRRTCVDDTFCTCDETAGECIETCGNGKLEQGEDCDAGANNKKDPPPTLTDWYCKAVSCTKSSCFDGGDNDHDLLTDAFDAGCWRYNVSRPKRDPLAFLGSLLAQTAPLEPIAPEEFLGGKDDEACPADTVDRGSFCALTCNPGEVCPGGEICPQDGVCPVLCPNGAIDDGEACDDGNLVDGDGCTNLCRLPPCTGADCPRCGDGVYQHQIGEQCDDGNNNDADACTNNCRTRCDGDEDCVGKCDLVTQQCMPPTCGDGETNQPWERCDDGNVVHDDECNNQCQPTCKGDADCVSARCDQKRQVCVPTCGNGVHDSGEQCDDGNLVDNDACNNTCQKHCSDDLTCDCDEAKGVCRQPCGNGRLDVGEGCDDGNADDRDACNNRCQVRCRPGTVCPGDQACPQNGVCAVPGVCGDGSVNDPSEQCDDGNRNDADACSNACRQRCSQNLECAGGLLCIGQECSECSNSLQCDGGFCVDGRCRQALPVCGNGIVEPGETCDDANADEADGCTSGCLFPRDHACVVSAQCQTKLCNNSVCEACASAGECGSGLRCAEGNCLFGSEQCGDGTVQAAEACDDANFDEQDECTSACTLTFGQACTHATQCSSTICSGGACTPCRTDGECSGGLRCAIGMCLSDAQMALLPNVCGNGLLEGGEACDDGNGAYGDGCTPTCTVGNALQRSEVAADVSVQLPFSEGGQWPGGATASLHAGAGSGLTDSGPATVAVMAAGASAGAAWVRRRLRRAYSS